LRNPTLPTGALALLTLLAGCGDLPQPFYGRPGATAMRLSQPPPSRLAIPLPGQSLLTDAAAKAWSEALATALLAKELPAAAQQAEPGDWRLVLSAEVENGAVVPTYTVINPKGESQGASQGPPVPASDWAAGQPATLQAAAEAEAPKVIAMLNGIEARRQMSDPHSLLNRPPVVFFKGVTGAPGDGNTSLAKQMTTRLPNLGEVVQDNAKGADFSVEGQVKTAPGAGNTTRIEIQWIIVDAKGEERGRVVQLNEVPPHSLDSYWGDVAVAVATEAAGGVNEVVIQASGRGALRDAARADAEAKQSAGAKPAAADEPDKTVKP
jgi:hypothetical protein